MIALEERIKEMGWTQTEAAEILHITCRRCAYPNAPVRMSATREAWVMGAKWLPETVWTAKGF
jgi:hypothetical protein